MDFTGIGWRQPHYRELLERRPALRFLEVHSENFFAEGGAALAVLLLIASVAIMTIVVSAARRADRMTEGREA